MRLRARAVIAGSLGLVAMACAPRPAVETDPVAFDHVLLVTIDTLRADHLRPYGYPRDAAPFLTGLAERGIVFEHSYTASSHTGPAHATLFTSLYPFQHRLSFNGQRIAPQAQTLADVAARRGYEVRGFPAVRFLEDRMGFAGPPAGMGLPDVDLGDSAWYRKENGIEVDRRKILLEEPIKTLGMFTVPIKLHADVVAHLKVWVVQE